ncbi:MAG: signal peptidase II [Rhodoluna sp.]
MATKTSSRGLLLTFLATGWIVVTLDQLAKYLVIENLAPGVRVPVLGELVKFVLVYNDSAAFSIGFGVTWIFTILSTLAALAILWFASKLETVGWAFAGGLALGGVVGNLIDRLIRSPGFGQGQVVDFISIPFNFPIFNIADMAIVAVAVIVVVRIMRGTPIGKSPADHS